MLEAVGHHNTHIHNELQYFTYLAHLNSQEYSS